jgi:hypothetical protein
MPELNIVWDLDDDEHGNVRHIADHDVTKDEVTDVLCDPAGSDISASTGHPIAFGYASTGRFLCVVYEQIDDDTVYPITAYEVGESTR